MLFFLKMEFSYDYNYTPANFTLWLFLYLNICASLALSAKVNGVILTDQIHSQRSAARHLREKNNEDIPPQCRTDLCRSHRTSNAVKGTLMWPEIQVGYELEQDCPWTQFTKVKVRRHCSLDANGTLVWTPLDLKKCPDPPIKYQLKKLKEENVSETNKPYIQAGRLHTIYAVYHTYHQTTPFDLEDVNMTLTLVSQIMSTYQDNNIPVSTSVTEEYLYILDILLSHPKKISLSFKLYPELAQRFLEQISELPMLLNLPDIEGNFTWSGTSVIFNRLAATGDSDKNIALYIPNSFTVNDDYHNIEGYSIRATTPDNTGTQCLTILMVAHMEIFRNVITYSEIPNRDQKPSIEYSKGIMSDNHTVLTLLNDSDTKGQGIQYDSPMVSTHFPDYSEKNTKTPWGPLLLLHTEMATKFQVTYSMKNMDSSSTCATSNAGNLMPWNSNLCTSTLYEDTLTCHCQHAAAYGIFTSEQSEEVIPTDAVTVSPVGGIDLFLGFPYNRELAIFGTVGNSLSLCGLVTTVLCYAVIRSARHGTPTWILIHLCISLILLIGFTFASEGFSQNRFGCSFANVIRYYLVFVSLLWNGIEGFNMYLMLVRVFNARISHFKVKAAAVAWGVPLLMIGVCEAVNYKAFHGQYVLLSLGEDGTGTCSFRCQLRKNTLLYAFVLPMSLIIIHNIIIFCMVLRVIAKLGDRGQIAASKKKNRQSQLVGALATLVLLGVPWLFSAFGVMDANTNKHLSRLEIVIQVIFVVSISLQGLFIFFFHCVRNPDIREYWKSKLNIHMPGRASSSSGINSVSTREHMLPAVEKQSSNI